MVYIFEGARNSGKTYLSNHISSKFNIPRFQFDFGNHFNLLGLESKDNREAHSFSMGKELMLMQLSKDLSKSLDHFIHDRGILTVLAWGLSENRISKEDVIKQIDYIKSKRLLDNCIIIYIEGHNPDQSDRNKDQWDYADRDNSEKEAFDFVISKFKEAELNKVYAFENGFNESSLANIETLFEHILFI
jgi:hypothetical protein